MDNVCIGCSLPAFPNSSLIEMTTELVKQPKLSSVKVIDAYLVCSGIGRDVVKIGTKICTMCLEQLVSAYSFYSSNKVAQSLPITDQSIRCVCCCSYSEQQVLYKVKTKTLNDDCTPLSAGFATFFGRNSNTVAENSRICKECFTQLESIFMFREFCKNAYEILKRRFTNSQKVVQEKKVDTDDDLFMSFDNGRVDSDTEGSEEEIFLTEKIEKPIKVGAKRKPEQVAAASKPPAQEKKEEIVQKAQSPKTRKEKIVQKVEKAQLPISNVVCKEPITPTKVEKLEETAREECYKDQKLKVLLLENHVPLDVEIKDDIVRLGPNLIFDKKLNIEIKRRSRRLLTPRKPAKREFKCDVCGATRAQKFDIKMHLYDAHFPDWSKKTYKCQYCTKMHIAPDAHDRHLEKHRRRAITGNKHTLKNNFLCSLCGLSFETKSRIDFHMECHAQKTFKCPHCPGIYTHVRDMERHIRNKHDESGSNRCPKCRRCLLSTFNLERHLKICLNKERYSCATCGRKFKAPKELKLHQFDHLGYHPYNCPEMSADDVMCGYSSKKKAPFIFHLFKQHDIQFREAIHGVKENVDLAKEMFAEKKMNRLRECSHQCDKCDKAFQTYTGLHHHKQQHLKVSFQCKFCDKSFTQKPSLWDHSFTHRDFSPYNCKALGCNYKSNNKKVFQVHLKKVHDKQYIEDVHGYKLESFSQVMDFVLKRNDG